MQQEKILRVLLADDHGLFLETLGMYLEQAPDLHVTLADDLEKMLRLMAEQGPFDVVLLDLDMPGINGAVGLRRVIARNGGKPVAILTGGAVSRRIDEIMEAGAAGILTKKSTSARSLVNAVRFLSTGERYLPLDLVRGAETAAAAAGNAGLTEKEEAVLRALANGLQNKEIAHAMSLAEPTIKMHVASVCRKLGASNRTRAVVVAGDMGLI